jgi:hypothetical protein
MGGIGNRVVLNSDLAVEIYKKKIELLLPTSFKSSLQGTQIMLRGMSAKIAKSYGVSAKTIRDIWNRKSWVKATSGLENQYQQERQEVIKRCRMDIFLNRSTMI